MLDEYEIRLSQANKKFDAVKEASSAERRGIQRRSEVSTRRRLQDRRQEQLQVEIERRREQRRIAERRSDEDRRVTSDYSQQRLEEEREKLRGRKSEDLLFHAMSVVFFIILGLIIYLVLNLEL